MHPEGKIEDILVKVDKFIFPVDFLVLDCDANDNAPIILSWPFFDTRRTIIDVENGELTMRINDQQIKLNAFHNLPNLDAPAECKALHTPNKGTKTSCLGSTLDRLFGKRIKPKGEAECTEGTGQLMKTNTVQKEITKVGDAFTCTPQVT